MRGTLVRPSLEVSHRDVFFGPCAAGERRDVWVHLRNPSESVPMPWRAEAPAHYGIKPRKGTVQPLGSQKVLVSFLPHSLGVHRRRMHIVGAQGLVDVEMRLEGHAVKQPPPGPDGLLRRSRGPGLPLSDHKPQLQVVPGDRESAQRALKAIPGYKGTVLPTETSIQDEDVTAATAAAMGAATMARMGAGGRLGGGGPAASGQGGTAAGLGGSKRVKPMPWERLAEEDDTVHAGSVTTD